MSSPPPPSTTTTTTSPTDPPPQQTPAPRKFPAPCWTQEETLALIRAYQDKWYSLRRRNLRTADWESVAADVTRRCPNHSPPKTSAQCRHKMEKLRKRYRTEKQRFLSLPHHHPSRFFSPSSWVFFDLMDSMESGSTDPLNPNPNPNPNHPNPNPNPNPNPPSGIPLRALPIVNKSSKEEFTRYFDEILMGINNTTTTTPPPPPLGGGGGGGGGPIRFKVKNHFPHLPQHQHQVNHNQFDNHIHEEDDEDDYYDVKSNSNRNPNPNPNPIHMPPGPQSGSKRKSPGQDYDDRFEYGSRKVAMNGGAKGSGSRTRDSLAEMVASIKMLGEGLVKMEKMKMDMMREIETMRMEMEMKRSEMILESQQLIVNAFVEGLKKNCNTNNNKIVKVMEIE